MYTGQVEHLQPIFLLPLQASYVSLKTAQGQKQVHAHGFTIDQVQHRQ